MTIPSRSNEVVGSEQLEFCPRHGRNLEPDSCGDCRRIIGIESVSGHNEDWLHWIRGRARLIAFKQGHVSANDLRRVADYHDMQPDHHNAWGSVFRGPEWVPIGFEKNRRPSAHARRVLKWALAKAEY